MNLHYACKEINNHLQKDKYIVPTKLKPAVMYMIAEVIPLFIII